MTELKKSGNVRVTVESKEEALIGEVLGERYEVIDIEGSGAMGTLYRGKHLALDRPVAIKVLQSNLAKDEVHMERFRREAKLAASLTHPNVAHVYDVGNAADGSPYLVMDFLDGRSLRAIVKDLGAIPARRALPLIVQIAQGLSYAASKGLLHRDLKLSNIMVVSDGGQETAKIIDFGIAKSMTEDQASQLTQTGEVFGSPLYMSPEQCQGHQLDARSDIYSLGCVMYEMLTGVPPLRGDSLVSTIYKHLNEEPKPFSEVAPAVKIPDGVEAIVFKCLKKNKEARPADASEVAEAVKQVMSGQVAPAGADVEAPAVVAHNLTLSDDVGKKTRNNFVVMGGIMLLVAGGMAFWASTAVKPKVDAQGRPIVREAVVDGKPIAFIKDDFLGDDTPITWTNAAAASQATPVLLGVTHQASDQPRSYEDKYEIPGHVTVHVSSKYKNPILVLEGYGPIVWKIETDPGVTVQKIIASGHRQQTVQAPTSVPVVEVSDDLPGYNSRTNNAFVPFTDLSNLSKGEDPTQNSYMTAARETIKQQTGGNDVSEARVTTQTHQIEF